MSSADTIVATCVPGSTPAFMSAAAHKRPVSCSAAYVIRRPPTISSAIVSGVSSAHRATALGNRFSRASTACIQAVRARAARAKAQERE
jgi:hypothetical protein